MDIKNLIGGNSVTIESVKNSPTRKAVFLSAGASVTLEGKERIKFLVELDGKQVSYTPNKTSLKNLSVAYGTETGNWIGKLVGFETGIINNKEAVIARPVVV